MSLSGILLMLKKDTPCGNVAFGKECLPFRTFLQTNEWFNLDFFFSCAVGEGSHKTFHKGVRMKYKFKTRLKSFYTNCKLA